MKLHFTDTALRLIAKKAIAKNTGARGLRAILENVLVDSMFEVFYTSVLSALRYLKEHSLRDGVRVLPCLFCISNEFANDSCHSAAR